MERLRLVLLSLAFGCSLCAGFAAAASTDDLTGTNKLIDKYGALPEVRSMSLSPDGQHYAFIRMIDDEEIFGVVSIAENAVIGSANTSKWKARSAQFLTNKHVLLSVSRTKGSVNIRGRWEQDYALIYNLETQKLVTLFEKFDDLFPAQSNLSQIVAVNSKTEEAYIPIWVGTPDPLKHLMRVDLNRGRARIHKRGRTGTLDWFVTNTGEVLAREDYVDSAQEHKVYSYSSGKPKLIYTKQTPFPDITIRGKTADDKQLLFTAFADKSNALYRMSLNDGAISEPAYEKADRDIDRLLTDDFSRTFRGLAYSGLTPEYVILDEEIAEIVNAAAGAFPTSSVTPVSATADYSKMLFLISGNQGARDYILYDRTLNEVKRVAAGYPDITTTDIANITAIRYPARDGTKIPAVLTWPRAAETAQTTASQRNLPTIVFPHGGPESYDRIEFDWWAQYLANLGYLVLQPNFRGSTGHGYEFRNAGRGEWGKLMQDDVTDGVKALIEAGYSDPERICIMGASYGGYAALAGGAFTPDLYRCVISVGGVSDLPRMLADERYYNRNNWVLSYWETLTGKSKTSDTTLKDVSPYYSADAYTAPVLLVHGKDDIVVLPNQSKRMAKALRKADKTVELVMLKSEDHWLSSAATRRQTLKEITAFLDQHNPVADRFQQANAP